MQIVIQQWEETERGWGTRPDGYSIHATLDALKVYIDTYWDKMPDNVPDEYDRPLGKPVTVEVDASHPVAVALSAKQFRIFRSFDGGEREALYKAVDALWNSRGREGWHTMPNGGSGRI